MMKMNQKIKYIKYLVFRRFQFPLDTEMHFNLVIHKFVDTKDNFYAFIDKLVKESQEIGSYLNVYEIKDDVLKKIAWIKKGTLYTL